MPNRLNVTADFVHALLQRQNLPTRSFQIPLMLGMRATLTVNPKAAHIADTTIRIPVKADKLPDFVVTLSDISADNGTIWALPGIDGPSMAARLPLADILEKALVKIGFPASNIRKDGKRIGVDPTPVLPSQAPVRLLHLAVNKGVEVAFEILPTPPSPAVEAAPEA